MLSHKVIPFGKLQKHQFIDDDHLNGFEVVPGHGANLLNVQINGTNLLDGYTTPEEIDFNRWSKSIVLIPFPNRLKDGTYTWKDKTYEFPINDASSGNALHGFGMHLPFSAADVFESKDHGGIACLHTYDGSDPS